ncbi:MAG: O-antigen ligase family protein [Luteolibacter sp.]
MSDRHGQQGNNGSRRSSLAFGGFWLILFLATFFVGGPWSGFHGCLFLAVGLLMAFCPPEVPLPRLWKVLAGIFMLTSLAAFLPVEWFGVPEWRRHLQELGVDVGSMVVIQVRQAAEYLVLFGIILIVGLWLAGHRASSRQLRTWALAFTGGVAIYAVISRVAQGSNPDADFGFFPNRNHTGTWLAMGAVCGLGNIVQAIRDRKFVRLAVAVLATLICFWSVVGWSVSRGGVLLAAVGSFVWIFMLGRHYLGEHGRRALGLLALAIVGGFLIADSSVKARISATMEKAGNVMSKEDPAAPAEGKPATDQVQDLDFRIPTALDTLTMIREFKWTGVGSGQFYYIFPQYRNLTAVANDSDNFHPESDWLWVASEAGVPATLALLALVICAFGKSLREILKGRDRALRAACFTAALLVPLHGVFDVPGHRITLAWGAVFLFCLARHAPRDETALERPPARLRLVFSFAALGILAASVFLIRSQWYGGPHSAIDAGNLACDRAVELYSEDRANKRSAEAEGKVYAPRPGEDLLEQALVPLEAAARLAPLHRRVRHLQGFIALHFEDLGALVRTSFPIELQLDPTWVSSPLDQALAWSNSDQGETVRLWGEALRRARWLDQNHPGSWWNEVRTRQRIQEQARSKPELEQLWKESFGGGK